MNHEIYQALCTARVPSRLEPVGVLANSNLRPDGATIVPWKLGKFAAWDVTVADTFAPSYISKTSVMSGSAATQREGSKRIAYRDLPPEYDFYPIGLETLGGMGDEAKKFLEELKSRLRLMGDERSGDYFFQRLSLHLIRGNAASVMATMSNGKGYDLDNVAVIVDEDINARL